ncbi:MAG: YidC/Oxa1 family membrane protein insertase [Treponema sp.]|nr:YidC/Oxa1 family membrane protein insertase [Treponema sp.]MCL2250387.1 YidC/Oxa1 family membrane protein insertase [Treponema sp.]
MVAEKWQEIERKTIQKLKPKINKIKKAFKGDEQYMVLATYYKQNHYHPIYALRSTFGLLIQVPFFIAAYKYLSHLEILKGASFLFINNLGAPDSLIPIAGGINLLPILMTCINCVSAAVYAHSFDLKDKIQLYLISLIFLILLYNSPSGLVLYWTLNNIFSLLKNIYFKIPLHSKKYLIFSLITALCAILAFYSLFILRRDLNMRITLASLFLFCSLIPWIIPLLFKIASKIPCVNYPDKTLLFIFLFSMLSLCVLNGMLIPSMLIVSSPAEFSNIDTYKTPLFFIGNTALQSIGFFVFWPLCLYFLFSLSIKRIFSLLSICFFLVSIINVFFFPGNYGLISIEIIFPGVSHSFKEIIFNIFIVLLLLSISIFIFLRAGKKVLLPLVTLPLLAIFSISIINIIKIQIEYKKTQVYFTEKQTITAIEPIFNLSKTGKNTIIIMLDHATSGFIPFILDESPELLNIYSGFVYYPNTVTFNGYTLLGTPPLFGGYEYTPEGINKRDDILMRDKHNEALLLLPKLFMDAGFEVTVTDPPYPNYSFRNDLRIYDQYPEMKALITKSIYTDYWLTEQNMSLPSISDILKRNIFWYSLFRIMPYLFRAGIYQHGDWFSTYSNHKFISNLDSYSVLHYLPRLTGFSCEKENSFVFIVNDTTHDPIYYQAPDFRPVQYVTNYGTSSYSKENEYHTNMAAFKRLGDWFNFLKDENVYDNTRIIIVSDHGAQINYVHKTELPFNLDNFNPFLLVKDFNSGGLLKTDMSFMTNADVPFLALKNQIENAVNPWTGKPISNTDKNNPLYISISYMVHLEPEAKLARLNKSIDHYVKDNIFIESNWTRADK